MKKLDAIGVTAYAIVATVTLAACNAVATSPPLSQPGWTKLASGAAPAAKLAIHHLYVAQGADIAPRIFRFPLNAQGLPASKPDGVLKLAVRFPGAIAIGPDGDLYVSEGTSNACHNERRCRIQIFAPGASGYAKPVRVLYVPEQPFYLAVDQQGYLDVSVLLGGGGGDTTNVYSPDASGNDQPINVIAHDTVNALGASHGLVYIQEIALGVGIEAVGERPGSGPPIYYTYGYNFSADGVATDATHLYAQFFEPKRGGYYLATAIFDIGHPGPAARTLIGTGCKVSRNGGALGYGLAVYKRYLYEGCIDGGGAAGVVLVYDATKSGKQPPVMQLTGGNIGVAVGP